MLAFKEISTCLNLIRRPIRGDFHCAARHHGHAYGPACARQHIHRDRPPQPTDGRWLLPIGATMVVAVAAVALLAGLRKRN